MQSGREKPNPHSALSKIHTWILEVEDKARDHYANPTSSNEAKESSKATLTVARTVYIDL